jgi:hypothetical protein
VVRQRYPQAEELKIYSMNQAKTTSQAYDSWLQWNRSYVRTQEIEALLYSKKFKEVVEEAIGLVSEDFRLSNWKTLLNSTKKIVIMTIVITMLIPVIWLNKILIFNSIDKIKFFQDVKSIMDKSDIKINNLRFYGTSNAGKILVANSIV